MNVVGHKIAFNPAAVVQALGNSPITLHVESKWL